MATANKVLWLRAWIRVLLFEAYCTDNIIRGYWWILTLICASFTRGQEKQIQTGTALPCSGFVAEDTLHLCCTYSSSILEPLPFQETPPKGPSLLQHAWTSEGWDLALSWMCMKQFLPLVPFPSVKCPAGIMCHIKSTFPSQVARHYSGEAKTTLKKYHPVHRKNIFWHWLSFCINNNKKTA